MSDAPHIHPTAIVDAKASVGARTRIGPYTVVGPGVTIGADNDIGPHVVLEGPCTLGDGNRLHPFSSVGGPPQDLKYHGEISRVEIGDRNSIREGVTIHRGTEGGGGVTTIGSDNLFMANAHVAHDCVIGDHVVLANNASPAGHVTVESYAIVGGLVGIHQFTRIGESAMLGGGAMVTLDVPPYCIAQGDRAKLQGPNLVGLKRRGFSEAALQAVRSAYRSLFQSNLKLKDAVERLREEHAESPEVMKLVRFIEESQRGICR